MAAKDYGLRKYPPYLPDHTPADFFLFPTVKEAAGGQNPEQETFKSMWEGAAWTIAKEDFVTAFRCWYEC
jgi:hypothetical protein